MTRYRPGQPVVFSREGPTLNVAGRKGRILVVDDDVEMRRLLADFLEAEGFSVDQASDGGEAVRAARMQTFNGIILDKNLPDGSGLDALVRIRAACPDATVVIITAFGDSRTSQRAMDRGAAAVLFKPFELDDLLRAVCA